MNALRVSKRELEIRDKLNSEMQELSKLNSIYIKSKHTFEWMTEKKYLIPEELKQELTFIEESVIKTEKRLNKLIQDLDELKNESLIKRNLSQVL